MPAGGPRYSFVVPVYDEEAALPELRARLTAVLARLDGDAEVVFVDDGSRDGSFALLQGFALEDERVRVVRLSRNFGHQKAITAGIEASAGDAVVILDADLQDPPEVALELVERWREGYDVVHAVRRERQGDPARVRWPAALYYRLLRRLSDIELPVDAGDFRLVDRRVVDAFRSMPEHSRYVRGMFAWLGFRQTAVPYTRDHRFAGQTRYGLKQSTRLAVDGLVGFSDAPLRLVLKLGFAVAAVAFVGGVVAIVLRVADVGVVPGWTSIVVIVSFVSGVQLAVLGMMGLYVARIAEDVRGRPLYVVRDALGFDRSAGRRDGAELEVRGPD